MAPITENIIQAKPTIKRPSLINNSDLVGLFLVNAIPTPAETRAISKILRATSLSPYTNDTMAGINIKKPSTFAIFIRT